MDPHDRTRAFAALNRNQTVMLEPEVTERIQRVYVEIELLLSALRERGVTEPGQNVAGMVAAAIVAEDRRSRSG